MLLHLLLLPRARWACPLIATVTSLLALPGTARAAVEEGTLPGQSPGLLEWGLLLGVFAVLWLLFYKGLYPLFLRYYRPDHCKFLFWSLFLLYALAWAHLSLYVLFDIGFYYEWARWVAVFLSFLWIIWFAVAMSRQRRA